MIQEKMFGCVFTHSHKVGKNGRLEELLLKWSRRLLLFWLLLQSCTRNKNVANEFLILQQYLKIEVCKQGAKARGSSFSSRQQMIAPFEPQTIRVENPNAGHPVMCRVWALPATSCRVGRSNKRGCGFGRRFQKPLLVRFGRPSKIARGYRSLNQSEIISK